MKAGSFNIHDYLNKLYEQEETKVSADGLIIPDDNRKAYDWLKKEYQRGKTEVKVEMSSHEFKPGYEFDTNQKSIKDFKPGMYGQIKTEDSPKGQSREKAVPFPETKFPGSGETKQKENDTKEKDTKENKTGITVQAKTKVEKGNKQPIGKNIDQNTKDKIVKQ